MDRTQTKQPPAGFTRRDFLRGSGAVAAAGAIASSAQAIAQEAKGTKIARGEQALTLNVNGKDVKVKAEPRTTLLEVLRYQLDLTGAKPVSSDASSGASTVLIDGKAASASSTLALQAVGKKILTVESLAKDAVPAAFVACDAQQCGFCTPGFVVATRAFLNKNPKATEEQIRAGLNGNICRCGTYANVIHAALMVVKGGANG